MLSVKTTQTIAVRTMCAQCWTEGWRPSTAVQLELGNAALGIRQSLRRILIDSRCPISFFSKLSGTPRKNLWTFCKKQKPEDWWKMLMNQVDGTNNYSQDCRQSRNWCISLTECYWCLQGLRADAIVLHGILESVIPDKNSSLIDTIEYTVELGYIGLIYIG